MNTETNRPLDAATTVEHSSEENGKSLPLVIGADLRARILTHLMSELPNEGCGLLAGIVVDEQVRATHFFPGTNIDHSPVRYTMDPTEVIVAMKHMRDEDWHLAAIVHSHPRTEPRPSRTDLREWFYPDARLVIVSFATGEPEFGCWISTGQTSDSGFATATFLITER